MRYRFRKDRTRLDRKVTFLGPAAGNNEFNETTGDPVGLFTTRCSVTPAPGSEKYANSENIASAPVLIEVRAEQRTMALNANNLAKVFNPDGVGSKTYEIVSLNQPERGANIVIAAVYNGA